MEEDTVEMMRRQACRAFGVKEDELPIMKAKDTPAMETIRAIIETEKEIAFKAGIKEVVDMFQAATIVPKTLPHTVWVAISHGNFKKLFPDSKLADVEPS